MKTFTQFLTAMAVLAATQYIALALGILLLTVAVVAAVVYPHQAFNLTVTLGLFTLALKQPVACVALLGMIGGAVAIANALRRRRKPDVQKTPPLLEHRP